MQAAVQQLGPLVQGQLTPLDITTVYKAAIIARDYLRTTSIIDADIPRAMVAISQLLYTDTTLQNTFVQVGIRLK